jgi:hypothetical protein
LFFFSIFIEMLNKKDYNIDVLWDPERPKKEKKNEEE